MLRAPFRRLESRDVARGSAAPGGFARDRTARAGAMSDKVAAFRDALSRFASGVVVVTTKAPEGPVGFTASAFSSVSLDPPLVLVCVGKNASAYAELLSAPLFG